MTIREAHNLFLSFGRGERNYAPETLTKLRDCFNAWLLPQLGDIAIEDLSRIDVIRLRNAMTDRKLGTNRQYSVLMALKTFCKFCRQVLRLNCLDPDREIRLPDRPKPFVHYLTNDEVARLRESIEIHTFTGLRMRTLIEVFTDHGVAYFRGLVAGSRSVRKGRD
jgi:site-specific recombinase XerD